MTRVFLLLMFFVGLLGLGFYVGPYLMENPGYVLITNTNWKIEFSLLTAGLLLIVGSVVTWVLVKIILTLLAMGEFSFRWFSEFGGRKKQKLYDDALLAWFSNDLDTAKKALSKLDGTDFDGMELLLLADVAAKQQEPELQKEALMKATKLQKTRDTANLLLAQTQLKQGETSTGLALIEDSEQSSALQLKLEAMANTGQWKEVSHSLEKWKKKLPKAQYAHFKSLVAKGLMSEIASKEGANQLITHWEKQPGKVRKDPEYQVAFISQLIAQGLHQEAESWLVKLQPRQYQPLLLPLFKELKLKQPVESRKKLELWLKQDDENADLLSALGHLVYNAQDYILAEKVLQKAIKLSADKHDIYLLAKVKEATQDNLQALQLYKQLV